MGTKNKLIGNLMEKGVLRTPSIIEAFQNIDRADFVSPGMEDHAYFNIPLPIGQGQTISQPLTVAFMLELLQPHYGQKILDIGTGSGWKSALLAHIVSVRPPDISKNIKPGKVVTVEIVDKLFKFSESNLAKYRFIQDDIVETNCMNAIVGCPDKAPFDRIISAAAISEIPEEWKEQLNPGGVMVVPVGSSIAALCQRDKGSWEECEYPGFSFVPFIKE